MANLENIERLSATQTQSLVTNAAVVGLTTSAAVALTEVNAEPYDRATIQIRHGLSTGSATITAKVFGTLFDDAGTVGGANWTQIGDDITITNASPGELESRIEKALIRQ